MKRKEKQMSIQIRIKSVYGNENIYPMCEKSKLFAQIAGTKTLTWRTIAQIKQLGYTIEIVSEHGSTL